MQSFDPSVLAILALPLATLAAKIHVDDDACPGPNTPSDSLEGKR